MPMSYANNSNNNIIHCTFTNVLYFGVSKKINHTGLVNFHCLTVTPIFIFLFEKNQLKIKQNY